MDARLIAWLRRRFVTGFFVMVPLIISVVALIWIFGRIDGITSPLYARLLGRHVPGLGVLTTAALILAVGVVATNVLGKRLLKRLEGYFLRVPVFRTVYAPVKQLMLAFSPDNEYGFKRVVMVRTPSRGLVMGFLTKEFSLESAGRLEPLVAVFVPTNHLYLGDIVICPREDAFFPNLSVEEGIRVFLTGGMTLPGRLRLSGELAQSETFNRQFSDKVTGHHNV
jgi:uncharacterized membrane protein